MNPWKANDPDKIRGKILKVCARQLAMPFSLLLQKSLGLHAVLVPANWPPLFRSPRN